MNKTILLCGALALMGAARVAASADAPTITVDTIHDWRSNSEFNFGHLTITLGLKSQTASRGRGKRVVATSVIDSTGQQLVTGDEKQKSDWDFSETRAPDSSEEAKKKKAEAEKLLQEFPSLRNFANIDFEVKNPARAAQTLREVAGRVEFYYPERDAKSVVTIANIGGNSGATLDDATLKAAGLKIAFLTAKRAKSLPAGKARESWLSVTSKNRLDDLEPTQLLTRVEDPRARLVGIEVETAQGQIIEDKGYFGGGGVITYRFKKPLPADARLQIYVATPQSVVEVPFRLTDVPLP